MKVTINNELNLLIKHIEARDKIAIEKFYSSLVVNKSVAEKICLLSTLNSLLFDYYKKKSSYPCEELFFKNIKRIYQNNIDKAIFIDYVDLFNNNEDYENNYIKMAIQYIDDNLENNLNLDILASQLHISKNYFSNLFKKVTGQNFSKYVNLKRVKKAKYLLEDTDYPLDLIAQACGYNSQSHFTTTFLEFVKETPGAYRNKFKDI